MRCRHRKASLLDIPDKLLDSRHLTRSAWSEQQRFNRTLPNQGGHGMVRVEHLLPSVTGIATKQLVTAIAGQQLFDLKLAREAGAIIGRQCG